MILVLASRLSATCTATQFTVSKSTVLSSARWVKTRVPLQSCARSPLSPRASGCVRLPKVSRHPNSSINSPRLVALKLKVTISVAPSRQPKSCRASKMWSNSARPWRLDLTSLGQIVAIDQTVSTLSFDSAVTFRASPCQPLKRTRSSCEPGYRVVWLCWQWLSSWHSQHWRLAFQVR